LQRHLPHDAAPAGDSGRRLQRGCRSIARQQARGESERTINGFMLKRGLFILLLDPVWMSFGFGEGILFQVLFAIGASFCCMILLRRISDRILLALGLAIIIFGP